MPEEIVLFRLDFDNCVADEVGRMLNLYSQHANLVTLFGSPLTKELVSYVARRYLDFPILKHMVETLKMKPPKRAFLMSFSNRQDYFIERHNALKILKKNGAEQYNCKHDLVLSSFSSVHALSFYQKILSEILSNITIHLFPFLLADFSGKSDPENQVGKLFFEISRLIASRTKFTAWSEEPFDNSPELNDKSCLEPNKIILSYTQLNFFMEYLNLDDRSKVSVVTYDDSEDILEAVDGFHRRNVQFIPKQMQLDFVRYACESKPAQIKLTSAISIIGQSQKIHRVSQVYYAIIDIHPDDLQVMPPHEAAQLISKNHEKGFCKEFKYQLSEMVLQALKF